MITACVDADVARAGGIGLPVPGVTLKLVPSDGQLEVRVQSPHASRQPTHHSGMLPGSIAGHYTFDETHVA